ncbi:diptericin-A-like [Teleopsis dalmanni]|uniref:diptericin-A-like n=1 Tax=Teleopsis dalmanni TaxID=139649 RepID=UPI0018CF14C7|nr:diptericin-A-like [Teleopsis dalmanni]
MHFKLVILFCALTAVLAYPYEPSELADAAIENADLAYYEFQPELHRERRQLTAQGGGSPGKGFDINVDGRAPVWKSENGRHQIDATGGYSQHLGGPYGNSRPDFRGGAVYTFRF